MRIHHVGIAVESLEKAVPAFETLLGRPPDSTEDVEDQKVRVAVFKLGESCIELLEATSPDSPVGRFISKQGPGIHHMTLAVDDLQATLGNLEGRGMNLIDRTPRVGVGGESIAFLHPSSTASVLIELLQEREAGREPDHREQR